MCENCIFVRHEIVWGEGNRSYCLIIGEDVSCPKENCKYFTKREG